MRVAVIGAGVAGLTAAHRLTREGHPCDVYERWPGLGGMAATFDLGDGALLERYYHHLFTTDRDIVALYEELGLPGEVEYLDSSTAFFVEGRSWPFTSPLDLLRFRPLSLRSRLRIGAAVLRLQRGPDDVAPYERVTIREWILRHMGEEAWRVIWGPLLRAKFGNRADDIAMSWLWKKFMIRRQLSDRQTRTERLGYPRHTWELLFMRLREEIERRGGCVLIDRPAASIARDGDGFRVQPAAPGSFRSGHDPSRFEPAGESERYDGVIATTPNEVFERLLDADLREALGDGYRRRLHSIELHAALVLVLALDRQFTPFYWTNVADTGLPFIGLIEQTNLVPRERYGGRHLLYVTNYLEQGDPLIELGVDELLARYEPGLRRVNPRFSGDWIEARWRFHEPHAQPIVDVGYRERIPPLQTPVPRLLLINTTQVYPEDRGTNYAVRFGERAAQTLLRDGAPAPA